MNIENAIRIEQARLIHRNLPTASLGGLVVLGLTVLVFWNEVPDRWLATWSGAALLLNAYRMLQWRSFGRMNFNEAVASRWLRYAVIGAFLSGAIWGAGALFMLPTGQLDYQLIFVYAVVMMSVASMFSYSPYYRCFVAFTLPCMLPLMIAMASMNTELTLSIGAGTLIFLAVSLRFMWTMSHVFQQSLRLRFENAHLVDALTAQKEAAEAANVAKSRFLAIASHDLRQPMHALNLYLGAFDSIDLSARARSILAKLRQCGRAMDEMFRALLDISRLDAGNVQAEVRAFDINTLLDRIRMEFEPQALAKGLQLRVVPCSVILRSDPTLVERILRNFAANAVMHTERGRILIGCRRLGASLRVAVFDTGPGIPSSQHKAVFDEFYQADNPERDRSKGLGLGLAIVDRLARLLIAPVTLRSQVGKGSMFAIDIQRTSEAATPPRAPRKALQALDGVRIVIVDDEAAIRDATSVLLGSWGCEVLAASSLSEALEQLRNSDRAPDVLLCDYRLRGNETGVEAVEALRAEFNTDIPALLITGDVDAAKLRDIENSGLPVLHKPLSESELRNSLGKLLIRETILSG